MKKLAILIIILCLCTCASTKSEMKAWLGKDEKELIQAWGAPVVILFFRGLFITHRIHPREDYRNRERKNVFPR